MVEVDIGQQIKDAQATRDLAGDTDPSSDSVVQALLAPAQAPDELGRLGGFRVLKELGRGGMGVVFHAEDPLLQRPVALKALMRDFRDADAARERFLREGRAVARLNHDHVVTIHEIGEDRGIPFLTMELLEGESLNRRLERDGRLPISETLRVGRETAVGLAAAHAKGIIHRDIKPANLWLEGKDDHGTMTDEQRATVSSFRVHPAFRRIKILDFGLARSSRNDANLTQSGLIVGTPAYMAPEQARGSPIDKRCDLFSLGAVLYQACTGKAPFAGRDTIATLLEVTTTQPPPPCAVDSDVPSALSELIMDLLAKDPADRPASANEVVQRIAAIEASLQGKITPDELQSAKASTTQRRGALALIAGAVLVAAATVLYVKTDRATLEIQSFDDGVKVSVEQGGAVVGILDPRSKQHLIIRSGKYHLQILSAENAGLELVTGHQATDTVTMTRGGKVIIEVRQHKPIVSGTSQAPVPPAPASALASLAEDWLKTVQSLAPERQVDEVRTELKKRNPDYDGKLTYRINNGVVSELAFCSDQVTDIAPVKALKNLEHLSCKGSCREKRKLVDLSPLQGMALKHLNVDATLVSELAPLSGMPLVDLYVADTEVADLSPLRGMPLRFLTVGRCKKVSDLSPLGGMPLDNLEIFSTSVRNLSPLNDMPLKFLQVMDAPVADYTPLKNLPLKMIDGTPAMEWWTNRTGK